MTVYLPACTACSPDLNPNPNPNPNPNLTLTLALALALTLESTHLCQVEEVLQAGRLAQVDAMRNILAKHEGRHQVVNVTGLA
jgi:hypothetical protein